jgi:hypothetical protein
MALTIVPTWDSSVTSSPEATQIEAAVSAAIQFLEASFTNNVTLNIDVGWGEVDGDTIGKKDAASSETNGDFFTYSQVRQALASHATSADDAAALQALSPTVDPTNGGTFFITTADEKALGLFSGSSSDTDGWIGLNSTLAWTFDPDNRAVAGDYDAIGAIEHEITEVMGRLGFLGDKSAFDPPVPNDYGIMDLFRYSSPGVRALSPGLGYFSVDGQTMLTEFNNSKVTPGDQADWDPNTVYGDSFGSSAPSEQEDVTATDLRVMDVIGYTLASTSTTFPGLLRDYDVEVNGGTGTVSGGPNNVSDHLAGVSTLSFLDGVLIFDPNSPSAEVYRLYDTAFSRAPDFYGAQDWTNYLETGNSLSSLAAKFASSAEFQADVAGKTNQQIVDYMYETSLHRQADSGGEAYWTSYLNSGHSLGDLILSFSESSEHVSDTLPAIDAGLWYGNAAYQEVEYMYQATFGRVPDEGGLISWATQVQNGLSEQAMAGDFVASSEFQHDIAGMSNKQIVDFLYETALGRPADPSGEASWTSYLDQGNTPAALVYQFEQSSELRNDLVSHVDHGVWV